MTTRQIFNSEARKRALGSGLPMGRVYQRVYAEIGRRKRVNVYALAKVAKCKPMDICDKKGWMPEMVEIIRNMNGVNHTDTTSNHNAKKESSQSDIIFSNGDFINKITGEIIEE